MPKMTDAEIVCSFMERPDDGRAGNYRWWWRQKRLGILNDECDFFPVELTLDRLHEVEEELSASTGWLLYYTALEEVTADIDLPHEEWRVAHASAEQKITALAAVLRPEVEGR